MKFKELDDEDMFTIEDGKTVYQKVEIEYNKLNNCFVNTIRIDDGYACWSSPEERVYKKEYY